MKGFYVPRLCGPNTFGYYLMSLYSDSSEELPLPKLEDGLTILELGTVATLFKDQLFETSIINHVYTELQKNSWRIPRALWEPIMLREIRSEKLELLLIDVFACCAPNEDVRWSLRTGCHVRVLFKTVQAMALYRGKWNGSFGRPASDYYSNF